MQTRPVAAFLSLAFPVFLLAHEADPCSVRPPSETELHAVYLEAREAADEQQRDWLDAAQRAWLDYRAATCALIGERETESATLEAQAQCSAFLARERSAELRLLSQTALAKAPAEPLDEYERSYYFSEE